MKKSEFILRQMEDLNKRRQAIKSALVEAYKTGNRDIERLCENELVLIDRCLQIHRSSLQLLKLLPQNHLALS